MADYRDHDVDDWEPGDYEDYYDPGDYENRDLEDYEDDDPDDYEDRDPDYRDYYENRKPLDVVGSLGALTFFGALVSTIWFVWWILRGTFFLIFRLMDSKPTLRGLLQKIRKSLAGK